MLQSPWDTDDGDEKQKPEYYMDKGDPQSGDEKPDDVEQGEEATWQFPFAHFKGPAEGPETEGANLDQLESEGDPDNGGHHDHATQEIANGGGESAEQ